MTPIGLLTNPRSRRNRRGPALNDELAAILGSHGILEAPADHAALRAAVARFREAGVRTLAINGGDGTVHTALSALVPAWEGAPLPKVLLLRGGTMNTLAHGLGLRGDGKTLLKRTIDASLRGEALPTATRTLLRVDGAQYGFLFGNGLIAHFLEAYYEGSEPSPTKAAVLLARAAASALVGGALDARLRRPFRGEAELDGEVWPFTEWTTVAAGTVDDIGLGFRPFFRCLSEPGRMHALGFTGGAVPVVRELWRIFRARPMRVAEQHNATGRRLVLRSAEPIHYMVDGDFHRGGTELVVETAMDVDFLLADR